MIPVRTKGRTSRTWRPAAVAFALLLLLPAACATVPYQQMSDARQAVDSAAPVVAGEPGAEAQLDEARRLLELAEEYLHAGEYRAAQEHAEEARRLAIESREAAR